MLVTPYDGQQALRFAPCALDAALTGRIVAARAWPVPHGLAHHDPALHG